MRGVLLAYKNETPEVLAWSVDIQRRIRENNEARYEWMKVLYDAHGVPESDDPKVRGAFLRDDEFSGIAWPRDIELPTGWFRPADTPQLIRPRRTTKATKGVLAEMASLNRPSIRGGLQRRFGMPAHTFAGSGLYTNGVRLEDDAVWVFWGSRDVAHEKSLEKIGEYGWVRVPLTEVIERFGEDIL